MRRIRLAKKMILRFIILGLVVSLGLIAYLSTRERGGEILPVLPQIEEGPKVTLYFSSNDMAFLVDEPRRFKSIDKLELAKLALNGLIKGPENKELIPTIPKDTKLRELYIAEGAAYPDFSQELVRNHWGGTCGEVHTVYSIVNTLSLNFEGIRRVQILVEGKEIQTLAGHLDTSRPLSPDISLVSSK